MTKYEQQRKKQSNVSEIKDFIYPHNRKDYAVHSNPISATMLGNASLYIDEHLNKFISLRKVATDLNLNLEILYEDSIVYFKINKERVLCDEMFRNYLLEAQLRHCVISTRLFIYKPQKRKVGWLSVISGSYYDYFTAMITYRGAPVIAFKTFSPNHLISSCDIVLQRLHNHLVRNRQTLTRNIKIKLSVEDCQDIVAGIMPMNVIEQARLILKKHNDSFKQMEKQIK